MKAKIPTTNDVCSKLCQHAAYRAVMAMLLYLHDVEGYGPVRLYRAQSGFIDAIERFEKYANGGAGDYDLFRQCDAAGIRIPENVRAEMMRFEDAAFQIGIKNKLGGE